VGIARDAKADRLSARRLFAPSLPEHGGELWLGAEAARHVRVLRLRVDDPLVLFDGEGGRAEGLIVRVESGSLLCKAGPRTLAAEPVTAVHLVLGLPKSGSLDDAVRGATEAGVTSIHLFAADFSPGRSTEERAQRRLARLERVAREASRQCERDRQPLLHAPTTLDAVLAQIPGGASKLLASAREPAPWPSVDRSEAWVAVGPEGGFSAAEEATFLGAGFAPISLGPHVLRAITAVPIAVALVSYRLARE
jgi:16S rRNA (uracil1498-N3)-methyltransferase